METSLKQWEMDNKKGLQPPYTAWPTLSLFLLACSIFTFSIYSTIQVSMPIGLAILCNAIAQFMLFTVLHDASHRSLSQIQWINESLGSISAFILSPIAGIRVFRFIHMQHHRFTNEGGVNDPDEWCGNGQKWTLPLRWVTLDLHYLVWYSKKWSNRPVKEKQELLITSLVGASLISLLIFKGYLLWTLLLWLIPGRIATTWLALAFDFLPHYPHDVKASDNEFRATSIKPYAAKIMTPIFLCQNLHLIHHLYPRIPFYKYPWVWNSAKKELITAGAKIMKWNGKEVLYPQELKNLF